MPWRDFGKSCIMLFVRKSEKTVKLSTTKRKNDQKRHLNAPRKLDELPSAELSK
jgi:hypothetical protein